jgi:hypothetical protein
MTQTSDWWDSQNSKFICLKCKTTLELLCNIIEREEYPSGISLSCKECKSVYIYTNYNDKFSLIK